MSKQRRELKQGDASQVLSEPERLHTLMQQAQVVEATQTIQKSLNYLNERRAMLAYATFQAQGYPIGSGSVESANKVVVQSRMKGAGMRWADQHVNAMLALRNLAGPDHWDEGWSAIRKCWQQEVQAKRHQRACPPSRQTEGEQTRPSAPTPPAQRSRRQPGGLTPPKQQAQPASVEQRESGRTRPAASHPWRRPFLPRRSA